MSFKCSICGKGPVAGKTISHSHKSSNRIFRPNVMRHKVVIDGKTRRAYVCTTCLRSGKVKKAP
jgi:large subunit ribosomal protein L28